MEKSPSESTTAGQKSTGTDRLKGSVAGAGEAREGEWEKAPREVLVQPFRQ